MQKKSNKDKTSNQREIVPFGINFNGSIADSAARILKAVCRLLEAIVDWLIWKLQKSMKK